MRQIGLAALFVAFLFAACTPTATPTRRTASGDRVEAVEASLSVLAADSMEGRATASAGAARAARYIADRLRSYGIEPAGDSAYFQRVPMALVTRPGGQQRPVLLARAGDMDTIPAERRLQDVNVIGILRGSDPQLRGEAMIVGAHFDHVGVGKAVDGDSTYNGADDDASGVVAVLEIARSLARGPAPKRTVIFLLTTGEEVGLLGTRWYIQNPVVPLERTVADLQIEMIGRPDSLAGGTGRAWLTGYERSTMGDMLARAAVPIVSDPRPGQNFFERSDNIAFARLGIPAHTLSSFNLHRDYHTPDDEIERVDIAHMTQVIDAATRAVRLLADGPAPEWKPGGRPAPPQPGQD